MRVKLTDLKAAFFIVALRARVLVAVVFVVVRFFAAFVAVLPKDAAWPRKSANTTAKMREHGGKSVMSLKIQSKSTSLKNPSLRHQRQFLHRMFSAYCAGPYVLPSRE
jgi:hypothetical protein